MLSLADELEQMNDFEDSEGSDEEMHLDEVKEEGDGDEIPDELLAGGIKQAEALDPEAVARMELAGVSEVGKVAKLYAGKVLKDVLLVSLSPPLPNHQMAWTDVLGTPARRKWTTTDFIPIPISPATVIALSISSLFRLIISV